MISHATPRTPERLLGTREGYRINQRVRMNPSVAGMAYPYDPLVHRIVPSFPETMDIERRLPGRVFVSYLHQIHGSRVIAEWVAVGPGNGMLRDIAVTHDHFNVEGVIQRFRYQEMRDIRREVEALEADRIRLRRDRAEAVKDFGKHMSKALQNTAASDDPGIEAWKKGRRGYRPITSEEHEVFDKLSDMARKRISLGVNGLKRNGGE